MSIKIKINWDNENVVSESVRIYRADSTFTSSNLPPLLAEILGDVYEYEDLTTIEGQTYYYMLSAKLDEQEVFTECFEVKAQPPSPYSGVYIVSASLDSVTLEMLREIFNPIASEVHVKYWPAFSTIPENAKLLILPHLQSTSGEYSTEIRTALVARVNGGTPILLAGYTGLTNFPSSVGLGSSFGDSSGSAVDIVANSIMNAPYNAAQLNLTVRQSSYYMSHVNGIAGNAKVIAKVGSNVVGAILQKGDNNSKGQPSPANIGLASFMWTRSGQLLNDTGKDLLREIAKKTMR